VEFWHFEFGINIFSTNNNSNIGTEKMEGSQYKLPGTSVPERGSELLCVACVLVVLGIIIICRFSN